MIPPQSVALADTNLFTLFETGAAYGLLPVALAQNLSVRADARQSVPAAGHLEGMSGPPDGPPLRLLVVGDGSAVGSGCARFEDSLAPRLAWGIGMRLQRPVHWRAVGAAGWTAARLSTALRREGVPRADIVLVLLGVNDAMALTPRADWRRDLVGLRRELLAAGARLVGFSGRAPVRSLPRFGWPLGALLQRRVAQLDRVLREVVDGLPLAADRTILHVPVPDVTSAEQLAADGMHASRNGYARWAGALAITLAAEWRALPSTINQDLQQDRGCQ